MCIRSSTRTRPGAPPYSKNLATTISILYDRSKAREPRALVRDTAMTTSVNARFPRARPLRVVARAALVAGLLCGSSHAAAPAKTPAAQGTSGPPVLKAEVSDVATLAPLVPHRFMSYGYSARSAVIYDGDTGRIEGEVPLGSSSNAAFSLDSSKIYVAETMWAHGNRGSRIDLFSIYDLKTLSLQKEIDLPGRALVGMKVRDLDF